MAKQTFTTGQVLTAAQMQSLQSTALGGGDATPKTASYVLVAADAGTTVAMNAAGATTITVNTGLFAAGDTVFIQNLGAGACTVTAGTATVATAGSLILPQNDAGILYFTSASAAIFYDYIQAGAVSPLTTKGDLYTFSTSDARLGVGANGTTLVADSSEATGLKWQAASSGGMTLLSTTSLSGSSVSLTSISQDYTNLLIVGSVINSNDVSIKMQYNSDTTAGNYSSYYHLGYGDDTRYLQSNLTGGNIFDTLSSTTGTTKNYCIINIYRYSSAENHQAYTSARSTFPSVTYRSYNVHHAHSGTDAITSIQLIASGGTLSGTIYLYGVK